MLACRSFSVGRGFPAQSSGAGFPLQFFLLYKVVIAREGFRSEAIFMREEEIASQSLAMTNTFYHIVIFLLHSHSQNQNF